MENKNERLDMRRLNEVIKLSRHILNIMLVLMIVGVVYIVTKVFQDWHVLSAVGSFLGILSPFFIGLVIAWLFEPFVTYLHKKGVNRILGSVFTFFIFFLVLAGIGFLIVPTFTAQINDIASSIPNLVNSVTDWINGVFTSLSNTTGYDLTSVQQNVFDVINQFGTSLATGLPDMTFRFVKGFLSGGVTLVFGLIIGFYMLYDFHSVKSHIKMLIPAKYRPTSISLLKRIDRTLRNYIQGTLMIMALLFILQSVSLSLVGIKAPLVFALFCAITNIIPYVGPWIGAIPVVIVGFTSGPITGILSIVAVVVAQSVENYFLQPVVMGKTMKLHPVTVMVGLLIFEHYFGIIGMILATPIISICKLLIEFANERYHFMDVITHNNHEKTAIKE